MRVPEFVTFYGVHLFAGLAMAATRLASRIGVLRIGDI